MTRVSSTPCTRTPDEHAARRSTSCRRRTGAAKATGLVLPSVAGSLDGLALRVPVPDASITDLVANLRSTPSAAEINDAYRAAAESGRLAGSPRVLRRTARLERHHQLDRLMRLRFGTHDGPRPPRQGSRLVRQRDGIFEPARRSGCARRRRTEALAAADRELSDVPSPFPRPWWPRRRDRSRDPVNGGLRRRSSRAGLPELRIGTDGCPSGLVLSHR